MADVAKVKADIKARLMQESWRQQFLTIQLIKTVFDSLDATDGEQLRQGFLRRLDLHVGRFMREKIEEQLSSVAENQVNSATADGCLDLDEYEKLI